MLFPLASASSFNASTNGGNMIFVYYTGRAGPTQFIVIKLLLNICDFFFLSGFFFHEHSRITELQGKVEGISLTPHYHFHPLHRH